LIGGSLPTALIYARFNSALRECGMPVRAGVFGAMILVEIENNGPVTIWLDTATLVRDV
jgi:D-tyrosyl-tRNA(Tyr) deacylase